MSALIKTPLLLALIWAGPVMAQDAASDSYDTRVMGLWEGDGGSCATLKGSWDFGPDAVRGNATNFDLLGAFGTADRIVLQTRRQTDGDAIDLVVTITGPEALAITAPGIAADVTRCHPDRPLDDVVAEMERDAAAFDAATFKPVRLSGLTCGDNCYVDFTEQREGAADLQYLCLAPECDDWIAAGDMPDGLKDVIVGARYGTGTQVDGSGTVMATDFPAITAFGPPDAGPEGLPLPLPPGTYVDVALACGEAPNAGLREFTGAGFNGSTTRDCTFYAPFRDGDVFKGMQTCTDTYDGKRTTVPLTVTLLDDLGVTLTEGPGDAQTFAFCQGD